MELRVLNYFLTVAREENFTRASEVLHITQPTLSRQLMQLEDELGTALFIRGKRKVLLTEAGMILKRRAEEILDLTQKAVLEIQHQIDEVCGEIVIACGVTEATKTMGKYIKEFQMLYPHVIFRLRSGNSDLIIESVDRGIADIGVVLTPVALDKFDSLRLPRNERWGILMKKTDPLSYKESIEVSDLVDQPLINTARIETQNIFKNWIGLEAYNQLNFVAICELTTTASLLVEQGMGYAIVIEGSVSDECTNLCFKPFSPFLLSSSFIIWKKYQSLSYTMSKFVDYLVQKIESDSFEEQK